jgi:hypothetical protein
VVGYFQTCLTWNVPGQRKRINWNPEPSRRRLGRLDSLRRHWLERGVNGQIAVATGETRYIFRLLAVARRANLFYRKGLYGYSLLALSGAAGGSSLALVFLMFL